MHRFVREILLPGAAITGAIAGAGKVIMGPLQGFPQEDVVNRALVERRTPAGNRWTWAASTYTDVPQTISMAVVYGALAYRATKDWREGVAPMASIALETVCFMTAAHATGRPRPDVEWLDTPRPTSSFPSGHTGATTAMHTTLAGTLERSGHASTRLLGPVLRYGFPPVVGYSRLYRGMHHPSDVVTGIGLGLWSAHAVRRALFPEHPRGDLA
ncbi:phosphatase PAP2 family protein [Actinomycetota bacterium]